MNNHNKADYQDLIQTINIQGSKHSLLNRGVNRSTDGAKWKNYFKKACIAVLGAIILTVIGAAIIYFAIPALFSVSAITIGAVSSIVLPSAITAFATREKSTWW